MKRFVEEYGPTEWKPNVLAQNRNRIEYYINPFLGDEILMNISVQRIERYYRIDYKNEKYVESMLINVLL